MDLNRIKYVYLLGIGGIGMSALARWFNARGCQVAGYDLSRSVLTDQLIQEGIKVHYNDEVNEIPGEFLKSREELLIIYTPAIPADHQEYNYLVDEGYDMWKRSEVVGKISEDHVTIAVAGTHGKTTTTSILSHILKESGISVTAFIGGITQNYGTNLLMQGDLEKSVVVVEADEYDRSFLQLHPDIIVITSLDPDHLDIYGKEDSLVESFDQFLSQLKEGGKLIIHSDVLKRLNTEGIQGIETYGVDCDCDTVVSDIIKNREKTTFHVHSKTGEMKLTTLLPGEHNIENMTAACLAASGINISNDKIIKGCETFNGVKRRFEYIIKNDYQVFIDDYAHHPVEINSFLKAVKETFPEQKVTAIFQPHLYSRTRDFMDEFAESLSLADHVFLMDIYPARERPIPGITSDVLAEKIGDKASVLTTEEILEKLNSWDGGVLATIGAGSIDRIVEPVKEKLLKKAEL